MLAAHCAQTEDAGTSGDAEVLLWCVQEMDKLNDTLNLIADITDAIKDMRTRHELTLKRNTEVMATPVQSIPCAELGLSHCCSGAECMLNTADCVRGAINW